jgi:DNA-binding NarL/FixJ family response regulator
MFKKVLIIEDIDSISLGITTVLQNKFANADIRSTKYCDEAYLKVKRALFENAPFDLIITDLSFKADYRNTKIENGKELIALIRKEQPGVKIIVYSVDNRPYIIKSLFDSYNINAFVSKGRESNTELLEAIEAISKEHNYISPEYSAILKESTLMEIDEIDIDLLNSLAKGLTQTEISTLFKKLGKTSSSTSSIEKRINKLKIYFKANNTIHLIALAKDMGVI